MSSFRVDLEGAADGDGERIGILFYADSTENVSYVSLDPEDALELAARLGDAYGLYRRWLDSRESGAEAQMCEPRASGLDVESYRLHILLESGYDLEVAGKLAKDSSIDLHRAEQLAKDAGPKLAAEILT